MCWKAIYLGATFWRRGFGVALGIVVLMGCEPSGRPVSERPAGQRAEEPAGHAHEAPRGGTLIELGDHEAAVEAVFDPDTGRIELFVLGAHAEHPIRLPHERIPASVRPGDRDEAIEVAFKAVPNELTGETVGDTSAFALEAEPLAGAQRLTLRIPSLTVRGVVYEDIEALVRPVEAVDGAAGLE